MTRVCSGAVGRSSLLCFALAVAVCAFGQAIAPAPQYRITGVLVSSMDGSPVRHGHLEAALAGRGRLAGQHLSSGENEADTDDNGRFVVALPSAGLWDLVAMAPRFARQGYLEHELFMTAVVLTDAKPAMDIRFAISPNAEIGGTVTDEAGEAVRGAQVSLMKVPAKVPGTSEPPMTMRSITTTDDRGMYEFDDLAPGSYRVCVQAQPWYVVAAGSLRRNVDGDPPLDPSLDVVYQATWYPGSYNPDSAETMTVKGGDLRQADIRLTPVPALHILVDPPSKARGALRAAQYMPSVRRVNSSTGPINIQPSMVRNAQGQIDVGGLTPGLYEVRMGGPGDERRSVIQVSADGTQTVSLDANSGEAEVSFHFEGLPETKTGALQVVLVDPASRQAVASSNTGRGFRGGFNRLRGASAKVGSSAGDAPARPQILTAPPGRYDVVILGRPDYYLTGIDAKGAQAMGRSVTLPAGGSSLTLHIATGRPTLTGFATFKGKPSVGSVVMLVPATLGETGAIQIVRRDQSNSDGSFNIAQIIPGQYILIAVEDGWDINWADASTMLRYLTQGVPVDLAAGNDITENIAAQEP